VVLYARCPDELFLGLPVTRCNSKASGFQKRAALMKFKMSTTTTRLAGFSLRREGLSMENGGVRRVVIRQSWLAATVLELELPILAGSLSASLLEGHFLRRILISKYVRLSRTTSRTTSCSTLPEASSQLFFGDDATQHIRTKNKKECQGSP